MSLHPDSFLVRITDFLAAKYPTLGTILKLVPTHHIIMENVLCDRQEEREADRWETYDLKPIDYFYPERDLVPEPLRSEETMQRLFDVFEDKIRITKEQHDELKRTIERDTAFLQSVNTVDYSLFLVRYPAHLTPGNTNARTSEWRAGAPSTDGKWKYRVVLLDFFWAKHKLHAQALTGVVQTFNVIGRKGPMSITTTAEEYRQKFLQMVDGMVEIQGTG
jgi:phage pi2 protein 07